MASRRYELGVGGLLLAALGVLAFMALQVGAISRLGSSSVDVDARFRSAAGLQVGAAVSIAGVEVGKVTQLAVEHDVAIVSMSLDPSIGIGQDAKVRVRARSLLGEKYVEIVPGARGAPALQDGAHLAVAGEQVEIDEILARMAPLFEGIDADQAGRVVASLADALERDPERLTRMLDNADKALAGGALAAEELPGLLADGRGAITQARGTLTQVDARVRDGGALLSHADRVLDHVDAAASDLPALTGRAEGLLADGEVLVGSLQERSGELEIVLGNFQGFDKWELRRLLREEGILVRMRPAEVDPEAPDDYHPRGKTRR